MSSKILLLFACLAALTPGFSREGSNHENRNPDALYEEARGLINEISGSDSVTARQMQRRDAFLAEGQPINPHLIRLFNEDQDDFHRWTILMLLSMVEGSKSEAIQLVESEFAKDPQEWIDHQWLGAALHLLGQADKRKARKAYVRILEVGDERDALDMATTMLEREGEPEDIAALERLIERRKQIPLAQGQTQDGVSFGANAAIKMIRERSQSKVPVDASTVVATQSTAPANAAVAAVSKLAPEPSAAVEAPALNWWPWGVGGALLLALLVFLLNKSK